MKLVDLSEVRKEDDCNMEEFFKAAVDEFDQCFILGYNKDGISMFMNSGLSNEEVMMLIEVHKQIMLNGLIGDYDFGEE